MLISEAFKSYTSDVIAMKNQSSKTEENHYVCMRAIVAYLGDLDIESLTFDMVRDWKLSLDKTRSPATVRCYVIKLRVVLAYCDDMGLNVLKPSRVPVPQRVDKVAKYLTKEQVAYLIKATGRLKNKCIISFLYASGLRISELCSLDRGQIQENTFAVIGKGGRARLCFLDVRTITMLDLYLQARMDNNPALFLADNGRRITPGTVQETFKSLRKITGIECSPHTMRHSFATNLLTTNTNLFHVQKLLGHRDPNTTAHYLHVVNTDLQKVYEKHHTI